MVDREIFQLFKILHIFVKIINKKTFFEHALFSDGWKMKPLVKKQNLGRIKPVFRGAYAGGTAYVVDDIVTHGNETFIALC